MKKYAFLLLSALTLGFVGCTDETKEDVTSEVAPTIALEKGIEDVNAVSFTLTTTNATEARYMVLADGDEAPALDVIMAKGVAVELKDGVAEVTAEGLEAETSYKIVAAAKNVTKVAGSNTLYVTTNAQAELQLEVEVVQVTHESMNFRVNSANAEKIAYLVLYASKETPEASYVLLNGDEVEVGSKESVEVTGLECLKEYQLVVVAEGNGQTLMAEPQMFTTKDDPQNVIEHNYTRARGTKYGSSYFMMFSYEDANEEDNFAYNDKTLSLDIYGDPDKDYLPAGTYEVKESTEPGCVSAYRYSTYGYDNGVQLSSGRVIVSIDDETKAYSFDIDLMLKDGRHLIATYTGDVDNMPVIDTITVNATFTEASATKVDGVNWTLNLKDDKGNAAKFDIVNAFKADYIVNNSYTISTSAEEFSTRAAEAGQFDGETSTFTVAGEDGAKNFLTGTLHVDIDWDNQKYMLSFYGTLPGNYIIEAEYEGAISGISLAPREEIIEAVLDTATARSFENNTNWYMTFTQTVDGEEKYRLVLDAFCPASEYLLAGLYSTMGTEEGRSLNIDGTSLRVAGEGQYSPSEARANVNIDMSAKTYSFDISFKVQDGRTFKFSYTGKVDGMEITQTEDVGDNINWTTFKAKNWYSDNWEFTIADADGNYTLAFDMRTGDSSLNYIPSGTYTLGTSGQYIDSYYSTFNGSKSAYKAVTLKLTYHEDTKTYDVEFDVTLIDDRQLQGAYSGVVEGTPKE
ncbi:MAG: hypothetical protein J6C56_08225 [Alistipes sp.]|nr:hypothetical protein [Alistipes sp.]